MLKLEHISKTFNPGTVSEKQALIDFSLHVKPGEYVTIIGANGAGKSTLFNAIAGSFMTDSGSISLDGRDITFAPAHERANDIGRIFQDPMLGTCPGMSIEENLAMAAKRGGWFSHITKADREFFREKLRTLDMGLEDRLDAQVGLLSGGQRQALTLLMATIVPPKLLLLDEHTAALDPGTAEKVLALTESTIREHKLTCLMITHNMSSALELGSRTLMLHQGGILMDVSGEERRNMTVSDLLERFRTLSGKSLDNDRMLLE